MASNNTRNQKDQPEVEELKTQDLPEVEEKETQDLPEVEEKETQDPPKPEKKPTPQKIRVRVRGNSSFYHPHTEKMVTSEFKDFIFDGWFAAQLAANLVEVQDLQGHNLVLVNGKLVKG